jgi:IS5 family transposase
MRFASLGLDVRSFAPVSSPYCDQKTLHRSNGGASIETGKGVNEDDNEGSGEGHEQKEHGKNRAGVGHPRSCASTKRRADSGPQVPVANTILKT